MGRKERSNGRGKVRARTPNWNHSKLPASPSDGVKVRALPWDRVDSRARGGHRAIALETVLPARRILSTALTAYALSRRSTIGGTIVG